jgi:hypothetical protein
MKTVLIPSDAETLNALLAQAVQENLILKTADGREFLLAEIDEFEQEVYLTQQNADLMALLGERSKESAELSITEVRARLKLSDNQ